MHATPVPTCQGLRGSVWQRVELFIRVSPSKAAPIRRPHAVSDGAVKLFVESCVPCSIIKPAAETGHRSPAGSMPRMVLAWGREAGTEPLGRHPALRQHQRHAGEQWGPHLSIRTAASSIDCITHTNSPCLMPGQTAASWPAVCAAVGKGSAGRLGAITRAAWLARTAFGTCGVMNRSQEDTHVYAAPPLPTVHAGSEPAPQPARLWQAQEACRAVLHTAGIQRRDGQHEIKGALEWARLQVGAPASRHTAAVRCEDAAVCAPLCSRQTSSTAVLHTPDAAALQD